MLTLTSIRNLAEVIESRYGQTLSLFVSSDLQTFEWVTTLDNVYISDDNRFSLTGQFLRDVHAMVKAAKAAAASAVSL